MKALGWVLLVGVMFGTAVGFAQKIDSALAPLTFLSGQWTSDSAEEHEEEYWSKAVGGSMVGTYRVVKGERPIFYEFWAIEVESGKAIFKMKHFNNGLVGWEEKGDAVRLPVVESRDQNVLFALPDGSLSLRYERKGDDLTSTLLRVKNGKAQTQIFHLHRSQ